MELGMEVGGWGFLGWVGWMRWGGGLRRRL